MPWFCELLAIIIYSGESRDVTGRGRTWKTWKTLGSWRATGAEPHASKAVLLESVPTWQRAPYLKQTPTQEPAMSELQFTN